METKFNFSSQICTNKLQSEACLKLGLNPKTADMTIHIKSDGGWYVTAEPFYEWEDDMNTLPSLEEPELITPAWSLHRLIEMVAGGSQEQMIFRTTVRFIRFSLMDKDLNRLVIIQKE